MGSKLRVIFVGAFSRARDGSTGGQFFACSSLCASPISQELEWILVDSSMESVPPPPIWRRAQGAAKRVAKVASAMLARKTDAVLLFSGSGFSLVEKGGMALAAGLLKKPVVFAPRGCGVAQYTGLPRRLTAAVLRHCDVVLCQSTQWRTFYQELTGLPDERFAVIPNWIDASGYAGLPPSPAGEPTRIVYMGWMVRAKGIFDVLDVVAAHREHYEQARFVMCGGGSDLELFRASARRMGVADLFETPGWVAGDQKRQHLQSADIFLLPSHGEGMPNALLEAMAAGRAVIATEVGGVPDIVTDGENGLLYKAKDSAGLVNCLSRLMDDRALRLRLGERARAHVLEHHDVGMLWPRVAEVLRRAGSDR